MIRPRARRPSWDRRRRGRCASTGWFGPIVIGFERDPHPHVGFLSGLFVLFQHQGDRLAVPAVLVAGRWRVGLDQDGEILVLDAGEDQRAASCCRSGCPWPRRRRWPRDVTMSIFCPFELAEDHVAEGAGVPFALDGDAVGPEQVVDDRPLLVGALELEIDLEPVGVGEQAERLGHDHAVLGRGPEDHRLAGDRRLGHRIDAGDGTNGLAPSHRGRLPRGPNRACPRLRPRPSSERRFRRRRRRPRPQRRPAPLPWLKVRASEGGQSGSRRSTAADACGPWPAQTVIVELGVVRATSRPNRCPPLSVRAEPRAGSRRATCR